MEDGAEGELCGVAATRNGRVKSTGCLAESRRVQESRNPGTQKANRELAGIGIDVKENPRPHADPHKVSDDQLIQD